MSSSDAVKLEEKKFEGFQRDENGIFPPILTRAREKSCGFLVYLASSIVFYQVGMLIVAIVSATTASYDYIFKGYQFDSQNLWRREGELGAGLEYTHSLTPIRV